MKTINKIFCALFVLTTIVACDLDKLTGLQDTFKIVVNPDAVANKKDIAVKDINGTAIDAPTMTISGDSASDVFTSSGFADLQFDQGQIVIGLRQSVVATVEQPVTINAVVSATGYEDRNVTFIFDGTPVESTDIFLLPLDKSDLDGFETVTETKPQGEAISVSTESVTDGGAAVAEVELPATTIFTDKNGTVQTGSVTLELETVELTADSGTNSGYSLLDETPEITNKTGETIVPSSLINLSPTINGELVIPSEITIGAEEGKDLYLLLPDNSVVKMTGSTATKSLVRKTNETITFNLFDLLTNAQVSSIESTLKFIQAYTAIDACQGDMLFSNNGASGKYTFTLSNSDGQAFFQKTFTIYAGNSINVRNLILIGITPTFKITLNTVDGVKTISETTISCTDLDTTIELESSEYPSATKDIAFSIECNATAVALDETVLEYKKGTGSTYFVYGKVIAGNLTGKVPVLEPNTGYNFKFNYDGVRENNTPVLGSKIDAGVISESDIDKICAEIN